MIKRIGQGQVELQVLRRVLERHLVFQHGFIQDAHLPVRGGAGHVRCAQLAQRFLRFVGFRQRLAGAVQLQV